LPGEWPRARPTAAMEFRIAADELRKALHRAQGIVER
jgi:hypothetical protein